MILSNVEILRSIGSGLFDISPLAGTDPTKSPFNTSAVDLRLGHQINCFPSKGVPANFDLRQPGIANFLNAHSKKFQLTDDQPFALKNGQFILGQTLEHVSFPLTSDSKCFSARVEGKSSVARCGIIVHFTAPTIHAGFSGPITLEIINLGPLTFMLYPEMFICQLIIEEVCGVPVDAPNQFRNQVNPSGLK